MTPIIVQNYMTQKAKLITAKAARRNRAFLIISNTLRTGGHSQSHDPEVVRAYSDRRLVSVRLARAHMTHVCREP